MMNNNNPYNNNNNGCNFICSQMKSNKFGINNDLDGKLNDNPQISYVVICVFLQFC